MNHFSYSTDTQLLDLTSNIVTAYVTNNNVDAENIPNIIDQVFESLKEVKQNLKTILHHTQKPAVPIEDSLTDDYIICLEDGRKLKMMKRHLKTAYKMTPDEYRKKWGLHPNYPMVARNYSEKRALYAKGIGLGKGENHHRKKLTSPSLN